MNTDTTKFLCLCEELEISRELIKSMAMPSALTDSHNRIWGYRVHLTRVLQCLENQSVHSSIWRSSFERSFYMELQYLSIERICSWDVVGGAIMGIGPSHV